mgnify:CR=1 FL=1
MSYGLIAVIIVIGIVIGAIATKKCEPFLIAGSIIGALFLYKQNFITEWVATLEEVMSAEAYLILVCGLFGSIIALLTASKGHFGFAKIVSKICNSERKTLFTTFILGVIIFIDDYLNVLSIGTAMKKVYDKVKVPREALAYLLDSTGSPVCVMFPFSSWAAYFGAIFFAQESVQALGAKTWMGAYIKAIPFCVYPIVALLIVILFSAGLFPKLGGMKKAYDRVAATGKVYSDASKKYNMDDAEGEQDGNILQGMRFLCAEDNELNAEILTELLKIEGAECTICENGEEILKAFEQSAPGDYDMILMDVQMPVMNGYDAARAIRRSLHKQAGTIPIIAMTANAFSEDIRHSLTAGMNAHIAKPVDMKLLITMINELKETYERL